MTHARHAAIDEMTAEPIANERTSARADTWLPGFALFLLAAQFMTVIMLAASIAPGYDMHVGAISDLGVIDQTAGLFNASLIAVGVLNLVAGHLFYRWHRNLPILAMFALAGLGAAGAGLVTLDASDFHGLFALAAFVFFNLEAIASGLIIRGPMRGVSLLAGIVGLAFVVLMAVGDSGNAAVFGPIGHGGAERMIVYPVMLWMLAFGGFLMAEPQLGPAGTRRARLHSQAEMTATAPAVQ